MKDGENMAQRFWGVYQSLLDKAAFSIPDEELSELREHVKNELFQKFRYYGSRELQTDLHLHENLIQECFAEICRCLANFKPDQNTFKNWVDGLILNVVKTYFRNKKLKQSLDVPMEAEVNVDNEEEENREIWGKYFSVEETILRKEKLRYYRQAMQKLLIKHPKFYQVIYYRCFQGLSATETSTEMNCSIADVYRWLNRALLKLNELIDDLEHMKTSTNK